MCKSDVVSAGVAEDSVGLLEIEIGMDIDLYVWLIWIPMNFMVHTAVMCACIYIYIN